MNIAASGLSAVAASMSAIASNIANVRDQSALSGTNGTTASASNAYQPVTVSLSAAAQGGVAAQTVPVEPPTLPSYAPSSPQANAQGLVGTPNVDLVDQMASLALAKESYLANLASFKGAQNMTQTAINLIA